MQQHGLACEAYFCWAGSAKCALSKPTAPCRGASGLALRGNPAFGVLVESERDRQCNQPAAFALLLSCRWSTSAGCSAPAVHAAPQMVDFRWLLSACPDLLKAKRLVIVHGEHGRYAGRASTGWQGCTHRLLRIRIPDLLCMGCIRCGSTDCLGEPGLVHAGLGERAVWGWLQCIPDADDLGLRSPADVLTRSLLGVHLENPVAWHA